LGTGAARHETESLEPLPLRELIGQRSSISRIEIQGPPNSATKTAEQRDASAKKRYEQLAQQFGFKVCGKPTN
jgi:hypothetical protein